MALVLSGAPAVAAESSPKSDRDRLHERASKTSPRALGAAAERTPPAGLASGASGTSPFYTVESGDTITGIAIRHGLRTIDLLTWNDLNWSSTIFPGQELVLRQSLNADVPKAPAPAPEQAPQGSTHTVEAGETVWSIAQTYGVSVASLIEANELGESAIIFPGQKLTIPGSTAPSRPDDTPSEGPAGIPDDPQSQKTHTVEAGDTLWSIAAAYGISVDELLDVNSLDAGSIIYPGQELIVQRPPQQEEDDDEPESIYDSPVYDLQAALSTPQAENARIIIQVGRELGVSDRGIAIALATAMVESSIRNLDWGDRDSLGLFQQRPSAGWGEPDELVDRYYATRTFFLGAPDGATNGLLDLSGWADMDFGAAAQAVQISAFPDRYDRWRVAAYGWLAQHG